MAGPGDNSDSKTEQATPRRREEARKKGQVAFSQELNTALLLLAGISLLHWTVNGMAHELTTLVRHHASFEGFSQWTISETSATAIRLLAVFGRLLGSYLLGAMAIGMLSNIGQIGFRVQSEIMGIKWDRLNPSQGYRRLFSIRSSVRGGLAILKLAGITTVALCVIWLRLSDVIRVHEMPLRQAIRSTWGLAVEVGIAVAGALVVVGICDFLYQRWQHEEDLKMSLQDLKEEKKQDEGDPQVKSRLRKLQRDAARLRMLQDVPSASVVLTNPTHFAVALRYEQGVSKAPKVVAKGEGLLAKRIARIAREHGVTVLERKPLTRALYASAEVGQEIPDTLFRAVAEVLAYVYRLQRGG